MKTAHLPWLVREGVDWPASLRNYYSPLLIDLAVGGVGLFIGLESDWNTCGGIKCILFAQQPFFAPHVNGAADAFAMRASVFAEMSIYVYI